MAINIHLRREGRIHKPFYRIVVSDKRSPRDGRFIEQLGYYNPLNKAEFEIDLEKVDEWIGKGAKPTNTVSKLMKIAREKQNSNE
ncbi:MAG: 30S ribosomal protein S16 [Proteobacteria bacterium]|nr:30S ribosomal protein S16 [Pseudomonadota bacterium]